MLIVSPSKGASIIAANERMINDTLMQLVCRPLFQFTRPTRDDLIDVLEEIADLRFGEHNYARPDGFYSGILFWEVFARDPIGNTAYRMTRLRNRFRDVWIDRDPEKMSDALRKFHTAYALGCQEMQMSRLGIIALIDQFVSEMR